MPTPRILRAFASTSAQVRLDAALAALDASNGHRTTTIIAASRGAADDFARALTSSRGSTFGLSRFSLLQFAARVAMLTLARRGLTPSTPLVSEAVATRAAFDAARGKTLRYFDPVATMPGFPRALANTLGELRGALVDSQAVGGVPLVGTDLSRLLHHFEQATADTGVSDRTTLLEEAAARLSEAHPGGTFVLLDVPVRDRVERRLIDAIIAGADHLVATLPADAEAESLFRACGASITREVDDEPSDIGHLRRYLFAADVQPPKRTLDGSLEVFSAPGEGRECVEIARRVVREAGRGVRFDEMAVVVRSPQSYFGLIEHAMSRAGVPVWFDHGTRRPHPAGRAFLALLACASERISATRFAEYLSLAQVPTTEADNRGWEAPADALTWRARQREVDELDEEASATDAQTKAATLPDLDAPVIAGTLRAPWRWEALIVDARIIGGGAARWRRRFAGHRRELERRLHDAGREEGAEAAASATGARLESTLRQLQYLEQFALPVVDTLESWSSSATWGEWLERFVRLAPQVLRRPAHVLRILTELRPMAAVGPVGLDEARRVLAARLLTVEAESPSRRYGRLFVGTPQQVRGRAFRVVFVPGLAERLFPQKTREDPLLLDTLRSHLDAGLSTEPERVRDERDMLRLAVGSARERLCASYPRLELSEARARVPSFYALDLLRAATGEVPGHETLEAQARQAGDASLAWPAPSDPTIAIDEVEHDLAVIRRLLDHADPAAVRGHGHYLLTMSEPLRRSVIERWRRARQEWSPYDGLTRVTPQTSDALADRRLTRRAYSLSALQRFSACPYQFALAAVFKLQRLEEPAPIERVDPLTRGSLVHEIQTRLLRELQRTGDLPLSVAGLPAARTRLDDVLDQVAARAHEDLAPAVERVWSDDVEAMRRDVQGWLTRLADEREWVPTWFEYGFGSVPGERDPASAPDPVVLDGGYSLRGAIDLIERHAVTGELRVTDYKTGRPPDKLATLLIGGGTVLQPVLYGLAAEQTLGRHVHAGRLFYCTVAGGFSSHSRVLDEQARRAGIETLEVIDRAIATGALMAAPGERACERCDFRPVCGPDISRRVALKDRRTLADLQELRSRP